MRFIIVYFNCSLSFLMSFFSFLFKNFLVFLFHTCSTSFPVLLLLFLLTDHPISMLSASYWSYRGRCGRVGFHCWNVTRERLRKTVNELRRRKSSTHKLGWIVKFYFLKCWKCKLKIKKYNKIDLQLILNLFYCASVFS